MATIKQAVYKLQRAADYFGNNDEINTPGWFDNCKINENNCIYYNFDNVIKQIGIQAEPKTKFALIGKNEKKAGGTIDTNLTEIVILDNIIIGRSGIYELLDCDDFKMYGRRNWGRMYMGTRCEYK